MLSYGRDVRKHIIMRCRKLCETWCNAVLRGLIYCVVDRVAPWKLYTLQCTTRLFFPLLFEKYAVPVRLAVRLKISALMMRGNSCIRVSNRSSMSSALNRTIKTWQSITLEVRTAAVLWFSRRLWHEAAKIVQLKVYTVRQPGVINPPRAGELSTIRLPCYYFHLLRCRKRSAMANGTNHCQLLRPG